VDSAYIEGLKSAYADISSILHDIADAGQKKKRLSYPGSEHENFDHGTVLADELADMPVSSIYPDSKVLYFPGLKRNKNGDGMSDAVRLNLDGNRIG